MGVGSKLPLLTVRYLAEFREIHKHLFIKAVRPENENEIHFSPKRWSATLINKQCHSCVNIKVVAYMISPYPTSWQEKERNPPTVNHFWRNLRCTFLFVNHFFVKVETFSVKAPKWKFLVNRKNSTCRFQSQKGVQKQIPYSFISKFKDFLWALSVGRT